MGGPHRSAAGGSKGKMRNIMFTEAQIQQIADIPLVGPMWATTIENTLCFMDALNLGNMREELMATPRATGNTPDTPFAEEQEAPRHAA